MSTPRVTPSGRWLLGPLVVLVVGLLLSGCAITTSGMHADPGGVSGRMGRMHRTSGSGMQGVQGMQGAQGMQGVHGMYAMHLSRCRTRPDVRGTVVRVHLMDMGGGPMMGGRGPLRLMAVPRVVPAGSVTFVATSMGRRTHELVVLPLGDRKVDAGGRISEQGALGEASKPCAAGAGDGLKPGTTGWVTLQLKPGRYELVCNEPHHYARGMHAVLVVR